MNNESRIKVLNEKLNRAKFIKENNDRIVEDIVNKLVVFSNSVTGYPKKFIEGEFPELLDSSFIESVKNMSYEDLMSLKARIENLVGRMLDVAEGL